MKQTTSRIHLVGRTLGSLSRPHPLRGWRLLRLLPLRILDVPPPPAFGGEDRDVEPLDDIFDSGMSSPGVCGFRA